MNIFNLLKTRIVFVSALSIVLIAATLIVAGSMTQQEAESRYQNEAFTGKNLLWKKIIEGQLDAMRAELFSFTRNSSAMSALLEGNKTDISNYLQPTFNRLKASRIIDGMQTFSANGNSLFLRPEGAGLVAATGVFKSAIETGKIITGIEQDTKGKLNLVFAIPLYNKPGTAIGVGVFTRSLQSLLTEFKQSEGSDINIVNIGGELVFSTNEGLFKNINPSIPTPGEKSYANHSVNNNVYAVLAQPVIGADDKVIAHLVSISEHTDSYTKQRDILLYSSIFAITIFVCILLTLNWYIRYALKPLDDVKNALKSVSDGDLTTNIEVRSNDEIGMMLTSVSEMVNRLRHMISEISTSTSTMTNSSGELLSITKLSSQGTHQQQEQVEQVASAMHQMTATVQEVARSAHDAASSATEADSEAIQGRQVVNETITSINNLAIEIENTEKVIKKVETDSLQIGTILDVIKGIAEQTNLLALNAAIEAARAGEQGRGFAVVADEVRTLASRTQTSTREIQEMIEKLQAGSQQAVLAMASSQEKAQSTVSNATSAGSSLEVITSKVNRISEMNTQIATAAEEQSAVAEEINRSVVEISQVAEQSAEGAKQTASASNDLSRLAQQIQDLITQFKV